jgi:DNA repair exonuclease SbcCD nuclease subunit
VKILFIGDPHLKINNFQQSIDALRWIEKVAHQLKPDVVCNLGDTFDTHAVVRTELLKEFQSHVETITRWSGLQYWYILGNHDQYKPKDSTYHALQTFKISGFRVFDKVEHLGYADITVVPYVQEFEDFPLQTKKICITHNTFIGADYGFKREDAGVNADSVSADIIISGHIHKRQQFGKVIYPGTPYAHNANDVDETKGLLLFDSETLEQTFIESPFPKWRTIQFTVSADNGFSNLNETLKNELNDNDKFILKVTGPKVELTAYFKSKEYLALVKGKNVLPKPIAVDKTKQKVSIKATSMRDIMGEYVDKVYDGSIDKQLILQKIDKLLSGPR